METWAVIAKNLPEHARNRIHTDDGAREAGYPAALVAGVTVYAYLTHVAATTWGLDWVRGGVADVAFRAPVLAGDLVVCHPTEVDTALEVAATVDGDTRATARFALADGASPAVADGEQLAPLHVTLTEEWEGYGRRAGDDLELYDEAGVVHPAVWPALANSVVHQQLARGSWIHTRSRARHHHAAPVGAQATVEAAVIRRFGTRAGERALLDVRITAADRLVAVLEHEAIVSLAR